MKANKLNITIVGGGPVGLFLGICLSHAGLKCTILEKKIAPVPDSRSLGIHPVSLKLFQQLDFCDEFLQAGIQISKGIAHNEKRKLGEINFSKLEKPFNFILACPQFETEKILTKRFLELNPNGLIRGAKVTSIHQNEASVRCRYSTSEGEFNLQSDFLIGCDGKNSFVRQEAGIFYGGKTYPDTYLMGDFDDTTDFGSNAAVFLPKEGLIESFPLPNGMRRWVVKTDDFVKNPSQQLLSNLVQKRLGYDISNVQCTMLSSFGVQQFTAEHFVKNRIILAGDAAHVVSPIGGQGMNLGWIGAWELSKAMEKISETPHEEKAALIAYQKNQKRLLKKVAKRAEWNMRLGRKQLIPFLKKTVLIIILKTSLSKIAAKLFTMRGL
tara:strand:+ start:2946 stop:4091 length:1146 start_codon:yes stop_codon:yes gene_type:complete